MIKKISIVLSRTLKLYSDKSDFTFSSFCKMTVMGKINKNAIISKYENIMDQNSTSMLMIFDVVTTFIKSW